MRVAFLDPIDWDYNLESPTRQPLGGSQSALCYLAAALAGRGHQVFTLNLTRHPVQVGNVSCLSLRTMSFPQIHDLQLDALIVLNAGHAAPWLRRELPDIPLLVFWTQHGADQPAVAELANPHARNAYDQFVFVSDWQRSQYLRDFGIPAERCTVLRNGIAPAFEQLFPDSLEISRQKTTPPVLAYTSTPFRGLRGLIDLFPRIRGAVPGVSLQVFSSMQVYHLSPEEDHREFGQLYHRCRTTDGMEYRGSIPQGELARQMRAVTALVYPNTFPETSCIAVMEAMAAGCHVITTELGALPETTAGFGRLISVDPGWDSYPERFLQATVEFLRSEAGSVAPEREQQLREQVRFVNESCTWSRRAEEWEAWLEETRKDR